MGETIEIRTENPLAAAPVSRLLLQFAIPSVLAMLVDALYNVVDQIFIGQGVGYLGIAAATVTFPFVTMILSIATLLGIGGSVYASMRMGAGKREEAEKALGTVFTLAAALGILFTAACLLFLKPLALAFGATEGVQGSLAYVLDYAPIILLGAPFSMAAVALSSMARADGSPVLAMGCFLAGAILNLILDPVYIFVLGWGVRGAAIATVTSQVLSTVILLVYFLKKGRMRLKRRHLCPALPVCGQVVMFGLPACMIQAAAAILQMELNKAVVRFVSGTNFAAFRHKRACVSGIWSPVYAGFPAGHARGRLPGCGLAILSGERAGRQGNAAFHPPPACADASPDLSFLRYLGNGRHFIRKPHGGLSDRADRGAAAAA